MRPPFPSSCGRVRGSLKSRRLRSAPVYQGFPAHGDRSPDGCDRAIPRGLQLQRSLAPTPPTLLSTDPRFRRAISARHSSDLESRVRLFDDLFLDIPELVLAEEHFLADEKRRRAETSARHRVGGVVDQLLFDVVLLGAGNQAVE